MCVIGLLMYKIRYKQTQLPLQVSDRGIVSGRVLIDFDTIKSVSLDFAGAGSGLQKLFSTGPSAPHANLQIRLVTGKILFLSEKSYGPQFWPIVVACKKHNQVSGSHIEISPLIPKSADRLQALLEGWKKRDTDTLQVIKRLYIAENVQLHRNLRDLGTEQAEALDNLTDRITIIFLSLIVFLYAIAIIGMYI